MPTTRSSLVASRASPMPLCSRPGMTIPFPAEAIPSAQQGPTWVDASSSPPLGKRYNQASENTLYLLCGPRTSCLGVDRMRQVTLLLPRQPLYRYGCASCCGRGRIFHLVFVLHRKKRVDCTLQIAAEVTSARRSSAVMTNGASWCKFVALGASHAWLS